MTDDTLTATLAEIRARADQSTWSSAVAPHVASAADVPRLLATVEAILAKHQPGRIVITGFLCKRHENHRYFSITQTEADDVVACKACSATIYVSCDCCGAQTPFESCRARSAISRALLGEERT